MKKLFKPACILFYFLMIIASFLIGLFIAKLVGAGKGQMLAGGAIVVFYGMVSSGIGLMLSFVVAYYLQTRILIRINIILGFVLIIFMSFGVYKFVNREQAQEPVKEYPKKTTVPANKLIAMANPQDMGNPAPGQQNVVEHIGIGFFRPNFFEFPTLYFYGIVNLEKGLTEHMPQDSVVFAKDKYNNPTTSYAPPWLWPEHLKLDYGIVTFKVLGMGYDFVKVEGNKKTGQLTYLDKNRGTFISWPEFLMSVNSVEFNERSAKKVFVKPLDYAGEVKAGFDFMKPLLVEEEWMYVKLLNESMAEQAKGWIRWKKGNSMLITYSLLS
jgi:hypothetical protein